MDGTVVTAVTDGGAGITTLGWNWSSESGGIDMFLWCFAIEILLFFEFSLT